MSITDLLAALGHPALGERADAGTRSLVDEVVRRVRLLEYLMAELEREHAGYHVDINTLRAIIHAGTRKDAGPWFSDDGDGCYRSWSKSEGRLAACVMIGADGLLLARIWDYAASYTRDAAPHSERSFDSITEARNWCDAKLTEHGYGLRMEEEDDDDDDE
jgi:hypothetical protein